MSQRREEFTVFYLPSGYRVRIGVETYQIGQLVGEGEHSVAYTAKQLGPAGQAIQGHDFIVKHPRIRATYPAVPGQVEAIHVNRVADRLADVGRLYDLERRTLVDLDNNDGQFVGVLNHDQLAGSKLVQDHLEGGSSIFHGYVTVSNQFEDYLKLFREVVIPVSVSPFVSGESLESWRSRRARVTSAEVISILWSLVRAVDDLHARFVVHNDLSSSNVLVSYSQEEDGDPHVVLIDFEQAHTLLGPPRLEHGRSQFAVSYALPERKLLNFDHDIHQIGCIALFLLTGRTAFTDVELKGRSDNSGGHAKWTRIVDSYLDSIDTSMIDPKAPDMAWIRPMIIKCTTPHHRSRYHSIHDLRVTINQLRRQTEDSASFESFKARFHAHKAITTREHLIEEMLEHDLSQVLARLTYARQIRSDYEAMRSRLKLLSCYGDQEDIVHFYVELMGSLRPGSKYRSYSTGSFWTSQNLGSDGRFLVACRLFVQRGGLLYRLFKVAHPANRELLTAAETGDASQLGYSARELLAALRGQQRAIEMLPDDLKQNFAVKVLVLSDQQSRDLEDDRLGTFISASIPDATSHFAEFTLRTLRARRQRRPERDQGNGLGTPATASAEDHEEIIFGALLRRENGPTTDSIDFSKLFDGEFHSHQPISLDEYLQPLASIVLLE
ncbi:MAG: protein kinase domain-containing protein [Fimbriimonas sp.]